MILPSGSELEITLAPFNEAKALYQAVAEEMKALKIDPQDEVDANFWKDIFMAGISSKKIENAIEVCMKRCTYKGLKIDKDTFEPEDARGDYLMVCYEIARANITPFTKGLSAQFGAIFQKLKSSLS